MFSSSASSFGFTMVSVSVTRVQREFHKHFKNEVVPSYSCPWVKNFREIATASNLKRFGKRRTFQTLENSDKERTSLKVSLRRSLKKRAQALEISLASAHRIIRYDFDFHSYKSAARFVPNEKDLSKRCLKKSGNEGIDPHTMLMTDEAHFHLTGTVNKQNYGYWVPRNYDPQVIEEKPYMTSASLSGQVLHPGVSLVSIFSTEIPIEHYTELTTR